MSLSLSSVGWKSEPKAFSYDWKTVVLYALGIGAQASELDYLYEARGPKVYPTFAVVPATDAVFAGMQAAGINLSQVVHGGQSVRVLSPPPSSGTLLTQCEIAALYDLKRFAQLVIKTESKLPDGTAVFETTWSIIVRDAGGFGGSPPPKNHQGAIPADRAPDFRVEQRTLPEQALLYRLSGDVNPLHADPELARALGFEQGPILHGLATFGFAARAIVDGCCEGNGDRIESIHGQFRRPVWPGETLVTEGWLGEDQTLVYRVTVAERNEAVMNAAWAKLRA